LWLCEDVIHVLLNNTVNNLLLQPQFYVSDFEFPFSCSSFLFINFTVQGTDKVEGIVLNSNDEVDGLYLSAESIMKMKRLRILKLQNINLSQEIKYLSNELRYLEWCRYPFKSLPSTFQPDKLVELHMRHSSIKQLWEGVRVRLLLFCYLKFSNVFRVSSF
jgi:hypothetical protein